LREGLKKRPWVFPGALSHVNVYKVSDQAFQ
ncbi:MAG: hypothetical protein RL066_723, partial [Actinomycetota bacterium]